MKICGLVVKHIAHFDGHNYLHMNLHMNADYCILLMLAMYIIPGFIKLRRFQL